MFQTIYEFADALKGILEKRMEDSEIEVREVEKNNSVILTGIAIRQKASPIARNIYINKFYEAYQDGMELQEIAGEIERICKSEKEPALHDFHIKELADFEKIRNKISLKLVNAGKNKNRLKSMPCRTFLDLAVIYDVCVTQIDDAVGSIAVTNDMMEAWGVKEEQLYELALQNAVKHDRGVIKPLESLMQTLIGSGEKTEEETHHYKDFDISIAEDIQETALYVATNRSKTNGAAVVLYPYLLDTVGTFLGDFFILPSSIHEILLLPADGAMESSELLRMVHEVNASTVAAEEVLSENVYRYDVAKKTLSVIGA